jgi:DNA helicase-2/ATP-dependent DNA helicase PcrA
LLEAFGMEVPDKRKPRDEARSGNTSSYSTHGHASYNRNNNGNSNNRSSNGNWKSIGNAKDADKRENGKGHTSQQTSSYAQHDRQRSAINYKDHREMEMLDERDEDRLSEKRGSGIIRDHKAFSTPGLHPKATSTTTTSSTSRNVDPSRAGAIKAERTETVAVWKCSSATCKAWLRQKPVVPSGKATKKSSSVPPVCPLCSGTMIAGTRQVPVTNTFGK